MATTTVTVKPAEIESVTLNLSLREAQALTLIVGHCKSLVSAATNIYTSLVSAGIDDLDDSFPFLFNENNVLVAKD